MPDRIEDYIRDTPTWLERIRTASGPRFADVAKQRFDRIMLVGSGTSYHGALQTEQAVRERTGLEVRTAYPFQVTREMLGDGRGTLLVGISQGGASLSTFDAMQLAKDAGCTVASMSAADDAYIDQLADHRLPLEIGEELAGAKTKGYYGTKLTVLQLAQAIGTANGTLDQAAVDDADARLDRTIARFADVYERSHDWVSSRIDDFAATRDLRFVAPSSLYGDALEIALKTLETIRVPVAGYEFNEFIHGIYNAVNEDSHVVFLDDGSEPRMARMVEVLGEWTDHVSVIANHDAPYVSLDLGEVPNDEYATFLYPIAGQLLAALVPWEKGYDPTPPKDPTFHERLASKRR